MSNVADIVAAMLAAGNPEKAQGMQRFFKTGKGEYGEGDLFIGLPNPETRRFAKLYKDTAPAEVLKLLQNPYHEVRCCGLLVWVRQYEKGDEALRDVIYRAYLANTRQINNWDLVDLSAPGIVGKHLLDGDRKVLYELAASALLWDQRIAMISTLTFIRAGEFGDALKLAEMLLTHRHDLMHKAVGWMLREVGKRDRDVLTEFLVRCKSEMPRTALRYAIEHYPEPQRREFLKK